MKTPEVKVKVKVITVGPSLDDAISLATSAHKGQKDKQGLPYILHPLRVMLKFNDPLAQMVAVLHDTLEDTPVTLGLLRLMDYPKEVVEALAAISRAKMVENYTDYVERCRKNFIARWVKLADIADNLDRIDGLPDAEERESLKRRYTDAKARLLSDHRVY